MDLNINTSPENFQTANYLLAQAIESLEGKPCLLEEYNLTPKSIKRAKAFRKSMMKAFKKAANEG